MPAPSTAKTTTLILSQVEQGEYYSAHLKARSTAARLLKGTEYDEKAKEAATMLFTSAQALLQKGQAGSGSDLALYLIDTWSTRDVECSETERAQITQLISLCGRSESWRTSIINAAISWTAKTGESPAGDAQLHLSIAEMLYKEKDYGAAEPHFLASPTRDSARTHAQMLYDWSLLDHHKSMGSGRYAARGVLSCLENQSILSARTFLQHYLHLFLSAHPEYSYDSSLALPSKLVAEEEYFNVTTLPAFNFLQLAISTCQIGVGAPISGTTPAKGAGRTAWAALWQRYEKEVPWLRTNTVKASKGHLDEIYFGFKKPVQGNPLQDMMSSLFGGGGGAGSSGSSAQRKVTSPGLD